MAKSLEAEVQNQTYIDLTLDGVLEGILNQGAEVVLFRNGIDEEDHQVFIDGLETAEVIISGLSKPDQTDSAGRVQFTVPVAEAAEIDAIRGKLRQVRKFN